jgi:hypothetical protein
VAVSDYTAAQVQPWAPEPRTAEWAHAEASDGRLVLVAADAARRPVCSVRQREGDAVARTAYIGVFGVAASAYRQRANSIYCKVGLKLSVNDELPHIPFTRLATALNLLGTIS